jgi:hypothetical protein
MEFTNKVAFTPEQLDYADFLVNWKQLDLTTCYKYIAHKFGVKGLDAVALCSIVKRA